MTPTSFFKSTPSAENWRKVLIFFFDISACNVCSKQIKKILLINCPECRDVRESVVLFFVSG